MLSNARHLQNVRGKFEKIDSDLRLTLYKTRYFKPNLQLKFERGHYLVKTVENGSELEACLKLRFDVFFREYQNQNRSYGVDVDGLDLQCDHLAIFDTRTSRPIGTYRLNSSLFSSSYYSTGEFQMDRLLKMSGNKLELGRACIDREHRNGVVIALLWRGISEYLQKTETKIMFGCASIKTMEPMEIAAVTLLLTERGLLTHQFDVSPTKKYRVKQLSHSLDYLRSTPSAMNREETAKLIPPLLSSYFKMNAKICGEPALDRAFGCIDFLTMIDLDEMSEAYKEKYKV